MKFIYRLKILLFLLVFCNANCQNANPSAGSMMHFENYPVDLSTGMPDVSIPLYTMPTRSKDITVNLSLNYHPSSISAYGRRMGNCGSGWNLSAGGVISRGRDEATNGVYSFSFMGFSGKFVYFTINGNPVITITENNGPKVVIEPEYASPSDLTGYSIYDDKGYRYRFVTKDIIYVLLNGVMTAKENTFQLSEIYDNNNNLLVSFNYQTYNEPVKDGAIFRYNLLNVLSSIVVPGYGTVELQSQGYYLQDGFWVAFDEMNVLDVLGNNVRNFDFYQNPHYDIRGNFVIELDEVREGDLPGTEVLSYKFFYRPIPQTNLANPDVEGIDEWGYYNFTNKWCNEYPLNSFVDPDRITSCVLEKMIMPTGGCIIYNYEANTYSFDGGVQMDLFNGSVNTDFYYNLAEPKNIQNYNMTFLGTPTQDAMLSFSLAQTTRVYFKFSGVSADSGLDYPDGSPIFLYPDYTLWNNTLGNHYNNVEDFTYQPTPNGNGNDRYWSNQEHNCLGAYEDLAQGNYTIEKSLYGTLPFAKAYTLTPKTPSERWWHGGGIRIKAIASFSDSNVPQDYFDLDPQTPGLAVPTKLISYKYNVFNDPSVSSGCKTVNEDADKVAIRYRDVTVYEGTGTGRTEYTFFSPMDFVVDGSYFYADDYRLGKLKTKKIYAEGSTTPQLQSDYEYNWVNGDPNSLGSSIEVMGWAVPKQITNLEYFATGNVQTKDVFVYDNKNKLTQKTTSTSRSAESLITKNYYTYSNSIYSENRIEIDYVEQFLDTQLLSTSKVEYLNSWTDNSDTNVSYLPSAIKLSKGSGSLQLKNKVNRYDKYGHVLESEKVGGIKTSYVWGYNNTMIIAQIDGVTYSNIPVALIDAAKLASDSGNESNLLTALTNLRNASQVSAGFVTTYTYKPLVGISTVTDPRGYKIKYEYDVIGRQTAMKDQDGNIITENIYHTIPQN